MREIEINIKVKVDDLDYRQINRVVNAVDDTLRELADNFEIDDYELNKKSS